MAPDHHLTDEDLLLDYYGEGSEDDRARLRAHLDECEPCRAIDRELRGVLSLVETTAVPEAPAEFEREMWARLESRITERVRPRRLRWLDLPSFSGPRWALAGGVAALAIAAFVLGRVSSPSPTPSPESAADTRVVTERLVRTEVEDHLERSQRMLVELVNGDEVTPASLVGDSARAADLVAAGRLYRRSTEAIGDTETRDLLEDVERVLVEIANAPPDSTSNDLSAVRRRINEQELIFRLRVTAADLRERDRRQRPTW